MIAEVAAELEQAGSLGQTQRQVQQEVSAYLRRETRQRPMVVVVAVQV